MGEIIKRFFDIVISLIGLLMTLPVTLVVIFFLALESPRHIFFAQARLGKNGHPFQLYKFRKFPVTWKEEGPGLTVAFDLRMTRLGAFLEKTKIDELPQLWNVLKGDMAIVGPRPESMKFKDLFNGDYTEILRFKPGLFGPNQIHFRNEAELYPADVPPEEFYRKTLFQQKAESDLAYFRQSNLLKDYFWVLQGVWVTFSGIFNWRRIIKLYLKIFFVDMLMIAAAFLLAHLTRFSGLPPNRNDLRTLIFGLRFLPPYLVIGMVLLGCYRHPIRYFSISDALRLTSVSSVLWLLFFIGLFSQERSLSLYLFPLVWAFLLIFLMGPRVARKLAWERRGRRIRRSEEKIPSILIYGATDFGKSLSSLIDQRTSRMKLIGFIDDDSKLRGRWVYGHEVLGRESDLPTIHAARNIDEIWLTFKPDDIKRIRLQAFCLREQIKLISLLELEPFSRM